MRRIKTSTKIFLALAAAAVVLCVVNAVIAAGLYKKYDAEARKIVRQLDVSQIKVLDVALLPATGENTSESFRSYMRSFDMSRLGNSRRQSLWLQESSFENVRIEGDTLFIENHDPGSYGRISTVFSGPSLETIVIREAGRADEVIELAQPPRPETMPIEPQAETAPELD